MQETSSFEYQDRENAPTQAAPGSPYNQGQYRFSPDELHVLKECNNESFFKRSLPIGTILGLGTFSAISQGYLRPNARFGAFPKVTLAVIVGYFLGKLSYQQTCAEKLMALPGSYIGQLLRERRDGKFSKVNHSPTMFGAKADDIYSDAGPGSALDLDADRPLFSDDAYRPDATTGGEMLKESQPYADGTGNGGAQPPLSYDELRRKNRGPYFESRQDPYRVDPNSRAPIGRARAPPLPTTPSPPNTNKYGDVVD